MLFKLMTVVFIEKKKSLKAILKIAARFILNLSKKIKKLIKSIKYNQY